MTSAQSKDLWSQDLLEWLEEIKTIPDDEKKIQALSSLVAELPPSKSTILKQALNIIDKSIVEQLSRDIFFRTPYFFETNTKILAAITSNLSPSQPRLLKQVLNIVEKLDYEGYRVETLVAIAPHLSESQPQLLEQFLNIADYQALTAIIGNLNLSQSRRTEIWEKTFDAIEKIEYYPPSTYKVEAIIAIASYLSESEPQLLQKALDIVAENCEVSDQVKALAAIAAYLNEPQFTRVLSQALELAEKCYKDAALSDIAINLSKSKRLELLQIALENLQKVEHEGYLSEALVAIAPNLNESQPQLLQQVLKLAEKCDEIKRGQILVSLASSPHLSESQYTEILQQALNLEFKGLAEDHKFYILVGLSPYFRKSQNSLLEKALKLAENLKEERYRIKALAAIAPHFDEFQHTEILQQILNLTKKIEDWYSRIEPLIAIASSFREAQIQLLPQFFDILKTIQQRYLNETVAALGLITSHLRNSEILQTAFNIVNACTKSEAIAAFITHFQESDNPLFIRRILDIVPEQADVLAAIAPHLSESQLTQVLEQALEIVKNIESEDYQTKAIVIIAPYLSESQPELLQQVLSISRIIYQHQCRFEIIANIAPHLSEFQPQLLQQAIDIAAGYDDSQSRHGIYPVKGIYQVKALTVIASNLKDSQVRQGILQQAFDLMYGNEKIETLTTILFHLNESQPQFIEQAYKFAQNIENESNKAEVMAALVPHLSESERATVINQIHNFADKWQSESTKTYEQVKAIVTILPYVKESEQTEFLEKALNIVPNVTLYPSSENPRLRALEITVSSISKFQPQLLENAFDIVPRVTNESGNTREALLTLFSHLNKSQPALIEKALNIIQNFGFGYLVEIQMLVAIAPHLSESEPELLNKALNLAQNLQESYQDEEALIAIVPCLSERKRGEILQQSFDISQKAYESDLAILWVRVLNSYKSQLHKKLLEIAQRNIQNNQIDWYKEQILSFLSELASRYFEEVTVQISKSAALEIVRQLENDADRTKFISALAPRLSSGFLPKALRIITENITHPAYRAEAFSNLAPYIPKELCREALNLIVKFILGQSHRTEALCNLIPYLDISQIPEALNIADNIIQDLSLKACVLKSIAINLKQGHKNSLYQSDEIRSITNRILKLIQDVIKNEQDKVEVLIELVPLLKNDEHQNIVAITNDIKLESYKVQILTALVRSPTLSAEQLSIIKNLAGNFKDKVARYTLISSFLQRDLNYEEFNDISSEILDQAHSNNIPYQQTEILTEFAIYSQIKQHKALRAIRELNIPYLQCKYLERLIPHLQPENILEAESITQEIEDQYYSIKALVSLARKFPQFRTDAKRQTQNFKNIELLCSLAIEVPEILPNILKILELKKGELEHHYNTNQSQGEEIQILIALKPHLPIRIAHEIDRERKKGKIPHELWHRSLRVLRKTYRDALSGGSFRNDTNFNEDLLNLKDEIDALADMLMMRDLEPPVAVGILGGWGGGKSYIMHLMQNRILEVRSEGISESETWNENPNSDELYPYVGHIYQIKFDAWTYAKSDLWASLMQTIFFELDRQISLEQQLIKVGINPCEESSAKIWQVLYQANEEDRRWFLERVLNKEQLDKVQTNSGHLWEIFQESQEQAKQDFQKAKLSLEDKSQELANKKAEIKNKKQYKLQNLLQVQKRADFEKFIVGSGVMLERFIGKKHLIKEIKQEVRECDTLLSKLEIEKASHEQSLTMLIDTLFKQENDLAVSNKPDNKLKDAPNKNEKQSLQEKIAQSKKEIDEIEQKINDASVQIINVFEQAYQKMTGEAAKQWLIKNGLLIGILGGLFAVIILIIFTVPDPVKQLAGVITFLSPAIITLQNVYKSGQKWFGEFRLAIEETKTAFQNYEQKIDQRNKQLAEKINRELEQELQTDPEIKKLQAEVQNLENQVQEKAKELPENTYASLGEFISDRLKDGSYEKQLGIMHQVKQDLASLSYKLLPPPIDSKEYASKIQYLKKAFPRGPARVVLYIDDLDRCSPDIVVGVLEAVQLLVKNRLFIAVIAIDERYINRALAKYYQGVLSRQGRPSPADYLEKIIQIPYRVTPITESALEQYLKAQVVVQDSATSGNKFNEFSPEEFKILVRCCQEVDLSPRSLKRLTNVYKLFKVLNRIQGRKSSNKEQQAILALLAFSGRYPDLMRDILQEIEHCYEESRNQKVNNNLLEFFQESLQKHENKYQNYPYLYQELQKLKHDTGKVIPSDLTLEDIKQIFDFVRRFSFVGDIGYDADYQGGATLVKGA